MNLNFRKVDSSDGNFSGGDILFVNNDRSIYIVESNGNKTKFGGLPPVSSTDNGKVLQVVNGVWTLVTPVSVYSGSGEPSNILGNNGDIYILTQEQE